MAWQDMVVPVDPAPAQPAVNLGGGVTAPAAPAEPARTTVTVRAKLPPEVLVKKATDLGYAPGGAAGITQNIMRESGGDPTQIGDSGTSSGLFQHHAERRKQLEDFAKQAGGSPEDPDIQFRFADKEMREQYPKLRAKLMDPKTTPEEAETAFRTIFERPKVGSGPGGAAAIDAPNFKWSDYALKQHANEPDTDVVWMRPQDYLDLTPDLGGDAKGQKAAKELAASLAKGEPIEAIPTLDVQTGPGGSKVVDQDGRHRALAAQEAGLDLIPVAVKRERNAADEAGLAGVGAAGMPQKPITEIEGMTGKLLPFDFKPYAAPGKAAEGGAAPADGMLLSGVKGAAAGFGRTVLGAQELLGKGLEAGSDLVSPTTGDGPRSDLVGRAGEWLVGDAQKGIANLRTEMAPDEAAHPVASEVGDLLGSSVLPGGAASKIGGSVLRMGAVAGGISGLLEPVSDPTGNFTLQKLAQVGLGAGAGALAGKAGDLVSRAVGPAISTIAGWVKDVKGPEAVQSAAVQAVLRRMAQDAKAGGPTAQDMLDLLNANPEKPLTIADVGGPNLRALLGAISRLPGEAQAIIRNFHVARDLDARLRVNRDINENVGAGSTYSAAAALEGARARLAAPLYQEAFAANQQMESPLLDKIIRTPAGQKAMRQAVAKMQNDMTLVAKPDPELTALAKEVADLGLMEPHGSGVGVGRGLKLRTWDYVKRALDDQIGVAQRAGERDEARILTGLKNTMVNEMDRLDVTGITGPNSVRPDGGAYARGRAVYSGHSRSLDALEEGRKFSNKLPEEIEADLAGMTPGDKEFYRMGVAEKLRLEVGKGGNEAARAVRNQNMQDRLRAVLGSDEAVDKFIRSIDAEKTMFRTDAKAFGNSATAERLAEDKGAENEAAGHAFKSALQFHAGNLIGAGINAFRSLAALRGSQSSALNIAIARLFAQPAVRGLGQGVGPELLRELAARAPAQAMQTNTIARPMSALLGPAAQQGTQPMIPQ